MSLPKVTGTARLLTDPRKMLTSMQKPMCSVLLLFQGWRKDDDGKWVEGDAVKADAVAFEDPARALAGFAKGDNVEIVDATITGVEVWNDKPRLKIRVKDVVPGRGRDDVGTKSREVAAV